MSREGAVREALHEATHRMPGVPPHQDRSPGHQGVTAHGRPRQGNALQNPEAGAHHHPVAAHDRPPRVLKGWQNWIAALFSRSGD